MRHNFLDWSTLDMANEFQTVQPFPHIVIDDVLTEEARRIDLEFPPPDAEIWKAYAHDFQAGKRICSDPGQFPESILELAHELMAPKFLHWLERVSGIDGLIPDPYFEGGGLHCSGPGGILRPHTDFHLYSRLNLYRQINVLLYLNVDWQLDWGGCLELFRRESPHVPEETIVPSWGRLVVFRTDDGSLHGFPKPIVAPHWRRSFAMYYYTSKDRSLFGGDYSTYWQRSAEGSRAYRMRRFAHGALLGLSRGVAIAAHKVDPDIHE